MSKKKKIIILSVMIALLLVTGFLNVTLNNNLVVDTSGKVTVTESFYDMYRTQRDSIRAQELLIYQSIIDSSSASETHKQNAIESKKLLADLMEQELIVESAIRLRGFEDAVITISDTLINVFIKSPLLQESEVAQITQVVVDLLEVDAEKIIIVESE